MTGFTLTVAQLNEYVRKSLAGDPMLRRVCITGEISNFKSQLSGHWYFSLKDAEAAIGCVMFRTANLTVPFRPENGMKVRLFGSVGLYTKTGSYQFYAEAMEQDGIGELYLKFEALKRSLAAQGLFDPSLKKPLPLLPRGVGVITSGTGAVIHDIARVSWRRYPGMPLWLCPVKVQGEGAAAEIAAGLKLMDRLDLCDVLIVGRGGGSMEDLWPFNEEAVARAIAACRKPVISAVGHETDFTIADFAADVRAATPSAAAELAVPRKADLLAGIEAERAALAREFTRSLAAKETALTQLRRRIELLSPARREERLLEKTLALRGAIDRVYAHRLEALRFRVDKAALRISAAGPEEAFRRGWSLVVSEGRAVRSAASLSPGQKVVLRFADGEAGARITDD